MANLSGLISARADYFNETDADLGTAKLTVVRDVKKTISYGTASGKVDLEFSDRRTISGSSSEDIDLSGALVNSMGVSAVFATVKAILIENKSSSNGNLIIGAAATNTFDGPFSDSSDSIEIPPGEVFLITNFASGWTVTADTGDILKVENAGAGTATYDIFLLGVAA